MRSPLPAENGLITHHAIGIQLAAIGVLVLSFDALLVRLANADPWTIAFWRGGLMLCSLSIIQMVTGKPEHLQLLRKFWKGTLMMAVLYGLNGTLFVLSLAYTSTANTVVILSSSAFFAVFFSWLLLRERVLLRTWVAIILSVVGVLVVFSGSIGDVSWRGDTIALVLSLLMGLLLSLMRRYSQLPRIPIVALSGLVMLLLVAPFSAPLSLPGEGYLWLAIMGLVQIPLASVLIMNATRYLSSPEVSLFLLIETVFGPIWVWLVLDEQVPLLTLLGGTLILGTIIVHSLLSLKNGKR